MTKRVLKRLNLIQDISFEIPLSLSDFIERLENITDDTGFNIFESFSTAPTLFCGTITGDHFRIRPRRKLFDLSQAYWTHIDATCSEKSKGFTQISGQISVGGNSPVFIFAFLIVIYSCMIFHLLA